MDNTFTLEKLKAAMELFYDIPFTGYVCGPVVYHKLREESRKYSPVFPTNFSNLYSGCHVAVDYEMTGDKVDVYNNREGYDYRVGLIEARRWLRVLENKKEREKR